MRRIVVDQPERVMLWLADRTGGDRYQNYSAIGLESDGEIIAAAVYTNPSHSMIWGHLGGARPTPAFLHACFAYPFIQLGLNLLCGVTRADNALAIRLDEHMGFKRLGVLPGAGKDGVDLIVMGMRKDECRYLEGKYREAFRLVAGGS